MSSISGARIARLRESGRAAAVASRYDQETVALTVISSVASTYFQALELRDRIQVARQNLRNGQKILRGFEFEQSAGTATGLDVAQQETAVALLYAAIPPLEEQFRQTVYALAVLIGKTPESIDVTERDVDRTGRSGGARGAALGAVDAASGRRRGGAAARRRQRGHHGRPCRVVSEHRSDRERRVREQRALVVGEPGQPRLCRFGGSDAADLSTAARCAASSAYSKARYAELLTTYHKTVLTALATSRARLVAVRQTADQQQRQRDAVATAQRAYRIRAGADVCGHRQHIDRAQHGKCAVQRAGLVGPGGVFASAGAGGFVHRARRRLASGV